MGALALDNGGLIGAFHDVDRPDYRGNPLLDVALPYVVNEGRPVKLWISPAKTGKIGALLIPLEKQRNPCKVSGGPA
jgi:hypothetical protein